MSDLKTKLLEQAAERAAMRPEYLGWVLRRYLEAEALDWPALAAALGDAAAFVPLALCLRPRPEHFTADIQSIAEKFALDAAQLARIVRFVDALAAMVDRAAETPAPYGTLLAARSRKKEEDEDEGKPAG